MSTGSPAPAGSAVWKKRFERAKTVCFWIVVLFIGFWFCVGFFGVGRSHNHDEPLNPHKISQVPKVWPAPTWARNQEERSGRAFNPLRNFELKLQCGLESVPQDIADREVRFVPWHAPVPERPKPEPFKFHAQWAAENGR